MRYPSSILRFTAILIAALFAMPTALSGTATAAIDDDFYEEDEPSARVARVSFVDGDASLRQHDSNEWEEVGRNTPVFAGDEYYTGRRSRLEIQLGGGRYVRLGERTDVVFADLSPDHVRMEVPSGVVIVSVRDLDRGEWFEISAPAAAVTIRDEGVYRVDVDDRGDTRVAVVRGEAEVSDTNDSLLLQAGESVRLGPDSGGFFDVVSFNYDDDFGDWCRDRDNYYDSYYSSSAPIRSINNRNDIYGLVELAAFGTWLTVDGYGSCWQPSVGSGWAPYSSGYWQWYPGYGYTWISNEPWGWAPYHSGRWLFDGSYGWVWVPWSSYCGGNYNWRPHQTYFYGYNGYNGYAWVPLAPNEPYVPYRALSRRHHNYNGFQPVHLRNGRGVHLAPSTNDGRLKPVRFDPSVKGRGPVAVVPVQPARVTIVKPRFDLRPADALRTKPVIVKERSSEGVKPRRGADTGAPIARRPVRIATDAPPKQGREKPAMRANDNDQVPTMVDVDKPKPRRQQPSNDASGDREARRQRDNVDEPDSRKPRDSDVTGAPRRQRVDSDIPSNAGGSADTVKPRRKPLENEGDQGSADRGNYRERGERGDRGERGNDRRNDDNGGKQRERVRNDNDRSDRGQIVVTPRRQDTDSAPRRDVDSGSKGRNTERNDPPPARVERNNPPPQPPPPPRADPPKEGRKPHNR
jgi:hypothetical protein